jgi:ligand-binding sensor protein
MENSENSYNSNENLVQEDFETEEPENNENLEFNFEDILNQFDNINIDNNSRISKEDEEFCQEQKF